MAISPNITEFKRLAKSHNLIVLSRKFYADWLTPAPLYHALMKKFKGESFLLESVEGEEKICRFSFMGFSPICVFKSKGKNISIQSGGTASFITDKDPLYELRKLIRSFNAAPKEHLRFFGGFVGYAGYDLARFYEPIGGEKPDTLDTYDTYFVLPKFLLVFDHLKHQVEILSFVQITKGTDANEAYARETAILDDMHAAACAPARLPELTFKQKPLRVKSNFRKTDFLAAVRKAKEYIRAGENIQVVLSQRFSLDFNADPFTVYRYMRLLNPSPYMFYLNFKDTRLAGASPEMLLRCENGELITRPIAGTRKRGKDEAQDAKLAKELLADEKERAEHIMLVDLARNDLGRVGEKASVNVPIFMSVEKFSHVMHIISEVRAKLAKGEDVFSALASCFPAGTLSGAPKVRAMQIINELEPDKRGIYGGAVGYFSFTGNLDTCIIIRTILFKAGKAYVQAGAGLVNDSVPSREYQETLNKARAQILALSYAAEDKLQR